MAVALSYVTSEFAKILHKDLRVKSPPDEYGKQLSTEAVSVEKVTREETSEILNDYTTKEISKTILSYLGSHLIYIPLSYALSYPPEENQIVMEDNSYAHGNFSFSGKLTNAQKEDLPKILYCLKNTRSVILSMCCGYGKTVLAIHLLSLLKLKSVITCHRLNIMEQWLQTFKRFSPETKVQIFSSRKRIDESADVYIFNITNVKKTEREYFSHFGVLVVDEAHTACSLNNSKALLHFTPKYAIALTATPYRDDDLDKILFLHFGPFVVSRKLYRSFNYYIKETNFFPRIQQNVIGKLDWNSVLESQASNQKRNTLIIDLLLQFKDRRFMVLCKRVDQAQILFNALDPVDSVDIYTGTNTYYNSEKRILISTFSKSGVGFDNPTLDALLVAGDIESDTSVVQFIGRCFRRDDVTPLIIDLCDRFAPLKNHLKSREEIYKSIGGVRNVLD
jgi:superfamily II DNA or RNA helicase